MTAFEDLPPPSFEPAQSIASDMNMFLSSAKPGMSGESAAFILGALQMGRNILVALSMTSEEIGWIKELEADARRKNRLNYERRKPQVTRKEGGDS